MNQDCYMPWWKIKPIGEILGVRKSVSAWPKWGTEPLKHGEAWEAPPHMLILVLHHYEQSHLIFPVIYLSNLLLKHLLLFLLLFLLGGCWEPHSPASWRLSSLKGITQPGDTCLILTLVLREFFSFPGVYSPLKTSFSTFEAHSLSPDSQKHWSTLRVQHIWKYFAELEHY